MRVIAIIAILAGLFSIAQKGDYQKTKTTTNSDRIICFRQSPFKVSNESDKNETILIFTSKRLNDKNNNKRSNEKIKRLSKCACKHLVPELHIHQLNEKSINYFLQSVINQSVLQVFRL